MGSQMFWFLIAAWTGLCIAWTWKGFGWPLLPPGRISDSIPLGPMVELSAESQSMTMTLGAWLFGVVRIAGVGFVLRR